MNGTHQKQAFSFKSSTKGVIVLDESLNDEILFVEDKNNLLDLSINALLENGHGNIRITKDNQESICSESIKKSQRKTTDSSDLSFALIYVKPRHGKVKTTELLKINSRLKVIPLLLLVGPSKEMSSITNRLNGAFHCFKKPINLQDFMEKIDDFPIFWARIDNITSGIKE